VLIAPGCGVAFKESQRALIYGLGLMLCCLNCAKQVRMLYPDPWGSQLLGNPCYNTMQCPACCFPYMLHSLILSCEPSDMGSKHTDVLGLSA
jgi:hypothetical protein